MPIPEKGFVYTGSQEPRPSGTGVQKRSVQILLGQADLVGDLAIPEQATGLIMFAHGSGSSRLSPRNRYVADILNESGRATLLVDLLTTQEEHIDLQTGEFRFNIGLLAERLIGLTDWQSAHSDLSALSLGYFGASTGSAAALIAAAARPQRVRAVVSRGGRPDLAASSLPRVQAPTLLIVGGDDAPVIELNQQAFEVLQCDKKLDIVPGATHLFEEPGALETVAHLAADWYRKSRM
jgi:putative phosphoribosyl transferase